MLDATPPPGPSRWSKPEGWALAHAGTSVLATTWAFGGNAAWVQGPLALWAALALPILVAGLINPEHGAAARRTALRALWPWLLFNALVLLSCLSPGLRTGRIEGAPVLLPVPFPPWQPSAAQPGEALQGLGIFDGLYLTAFNVYLLVRRRAALRGLLLLIAANALVLAVFGTVQKLVRAPGLYFGHFPTPQPYFFATFVYDNHWGAFIVLMLGVSLGLTAHYLGEAERTGQRHTPIGGALVALLLLAVTVPLSGSRFCTMLISVLLAGAGFVWIGGVLRRRRAEGASIGGPLAGLGAALVLGVAAVWFVAGETIAARVELTQQQWSAMRAHHGIGARSLLYADTWRMARDRLWFGWGMHSFPAVFQLYSRLEPNRIDHLPLFYHDAHSDWLQSAAEHGLAGTALLGLCAGLPWLMGRRRRRFESLPRALLAGCGLVLLYAWIEFPFGNTAVALTWWLCFFVCLRYARPTERRE
jgi:O-antigen ligase